jgi:hypothetical protein
MFVLARLLFMAITLYMFVSLFLENFDDRHNAIAYKIYLFLFVFIMNFLFQVFTNLVNSNKIAINEIVEVSINNALLAVIAFDIYNDLVYNNFLRTYTHQQKILVLILLIIGFMTAIKILQLLISSN